MGPVRALIKWLDGNELLAAIGAATLIVSVVSYIVDRAVDAPLGLALLFAAGTFVLSVALLRPVFHTVLAPYHRAKLDRWREDASAALELRRAELTATREERAHAKDIHRALVSVASELETARLQVAHALTWDEFWASALPSAAWSRYGDLISHEPSLTDASRKASFAYSELERVAPYAIPGEPIHTAPGGARVDELRKALDHAYNAVNRALARAENA
ncbi:hypothetical protein [Solirubrobacter pauli]|uniref:hypothetical protein n=1 Tax=Solirubrobacter pauli TaxID=166793 RepID=UPI000EB58BBC|nr:hypothetical protein [Solirubrobacter pauli]